MLSFPLGKEAVSLRQAVKLPSPPRQLLPSQVLTFPWGKEATQQHPRLSRQALSFPPKEGSRNAGALLPPGEGISLAPSPASQAGTHLPPAGENSSQAGNNPLTSQAEGQVTRHNPRHSARQRALQASQGISIASQAGSSGTQDANLTSNLPNRLPQGSSSEDPNPKWVFKLSSKPLTPAQRSVLAKGPNFAVSHKQPPNLRYITAIEAAYTKSSQQDAEELKTEVNRVLRSSHPPNPT